MLSHLPAAPLDLATLLSRVTLDAAVGAPVSLILVALDPPRSANAEAALVEAINHCGRDCDLVARVGVGQYAIAVRAAFDEAPLRLAQRIARQIALVRMTDGAPWFTASMGISDLASAGGNAMVLLRSAATALRNASARGLGSIVAAAPPPRELPTPDRDQLLEREDHRAYLCPLSGHSVECVFGIDPVTHARVEVVECSAFDDREEVTCEKPCLHHFKEPS